MIEYKTKNKTECNTPEALNEMGKDNWQLICIENGVMIFSRPIKKSVTKTLGDKNKDWLEFRNFYKQIKDSGLSDNTLIVKYNKLCKEGLHKAIMDNLKEYKTYLEVKKKQDYALMASTYINRSRYKDEWQVVEDMSRKFVNDIFKERDLNADEMDYIMSEIKNWEKKHSQEIRSGVINEMIKQLLNK